MTDAQRRRRVEEVCDAALEREAGERAGFVAAACGSDEVLRQEVEALLGYAQAAERFLTEPLGEVAAQVLYDPPEASPIGREIGPYKILSRLGAGGMGEVYRARDTKLGRDVAIKVLPNVFVSDPDRLARFEREARLLATLNHPHIGAIYGLEDTAGVRALILELVEGPTLADRLSAGPLPVHEAVTIAQQIAEALEAAHEKGIIHRDLKPANIKVTPDGMVKVLDFGIAKVFAGERAPELSQSPTVTTGGMREGTILGTPVYMSPEQALGKPLDKRTDVWAWGCVLYEMLTGKRVFAGESVSEVLASVVKSEPLWEQLPVGTPVSLRRLLERCLQKDPKQRIRDIRDARLQIGDAMLAPAHVPVLERNSSRAAARERLGWWFAGLALVGVVAAAAFAYFMIPSTDTRAFRTSIPPPGNTTVTGPGASRFSLSPDGRRIVIKARGRDGVDLLWLRSLDAATPQPLPGTTGGTAPFWSPDSRQLAFLADGKLKKIDISGGAPATVADVACCTTGSWTHGDVILFTPAREGPLYRISASGGGATPVTALDTARADIRHSAPFFLPDGRHFLFHVSGRNDGQGTYIGSLDPTEQSKLLLPRGYNAKYADGHLFFSYGSTLVAQPFDAARLVMSGTETPLVHGIELNVLDGPFGAFSVSESGVLAYQTRSEFRSQLVWLDRSGKQIAVVGDQGDYSDVELSPDGKRATVSLLDPMTGTRDIWIYDLSRGVRTRFTFDPSDELRAIWSPDQSRIVFNSLRRGRLDLYEKASDGSGEEALLLADTFDKFPESWSPDGGSIIYHQLALNRQVDLWVLPLSGNRKPIPFLPTPLSEGAPARFSPDGKWIAFWSNEAGRDDVYVSGFPRSAGKWLISAAGGDWPRWGREGREILYLAPDNKLVAVEAGRQGSAFEVGASRTLFEIRPRIARYPYDVSADGQRFLVNTLVREAAAEPITLLVNWQALLEK